MIKKTTKMLSIRIAVLTLFSVLLASPVLAKEMSHSERTQVLEAQVEQMKTMMQSMQAELNRVKAMAKSGSMTAAKMQELDEWVASVKNTPASVAPKEHMVFFRGGYAGNDHSREGSILTDANALNEGTGDDVLRPLPGTQPVIKTSQLTGNSPNGDEEAWYFGAGFEFNLTNDLYGLMDHTSLYGEVTIGYKEFDNQTLNRAPLGTAANDSATGAAGVGQTTASPLETSAVCHGGLSVNGGGPYGSCSANVAVTQITITASPKIKFMHGSKFRPWVIPAGFAIHVISPPSDGVTVTAPGVLFAAGAEYNIWEGVNIGFDGRYHLVSNTVADVDLDGFEVGGYVGFGF